MGLSPYPTPTDAGVLCIILVNTAMSISIMKELVRSILHIVGIRITSWEEYSVEHPTTDSLGCQRRIPSDARIQHFRTLTPSIRFDSVPIVNQPEMECPVCLTEFKPEAEINHLSCGHVFHKTCLEKWVNCWNFTCPLCRNQIISYEGEEDETCPM
ncbi:hypothetical protein LguiB_002703 [Lonicera macranthoides]